MPWTKLVSFLKEVRDEMQRVSWPSKDKTIRLTTIVIVLTVGVGIYVGLLDVLLTKLTTAFFVR